VRTGTATYFKLFILVFACLAFISPRVKADAPLTIVIEGFRSDAGQARIVLFQSRAGYYGETPAYRIAHAPIRDRRATWDAGDLPAGTYAAIVHHDKNANDALDRPLFSLPLEPYGFSNNAFRMFGIPDFETVMFGVGDRPVKQSISIRYNPLAAPIVVLQPYRNLLLLTLVLFLPIMVVRPVSRWFGGPAFAFRRLGRIGLSLFLLMTSSAHFLNAPGMVLMLPEWVPSRILIIYATGLLEVVLAAALWVPGRIRHAGIAVACMLMLFLPANIFAAWNSVPFGGNELGPGYLWVRIPYQVFLVAWTLWATGWPAKAGRRDLNGQ
jgi:uncharacterized protein (DUF2141 family)/uncharacterized membrane protein